MKRVSETEVFRRKRKILHAAVHHYIKTGVPASSKILVSKYGIKYSPATVRNILAELEDEGYLSQIHTSSGRIPTDKGYRSYVDMLTDVQRAVINEVKAFKKEYNKKILEVEEVLINTSKILSNLSHYVGFITLSDKDKSIIKNVELLPLADDKVLFIYVTDTSIVRHKILNIQLSKRNLRYVSEYLKEKLEGLMLCELRLQMHKILNDIDLEALQISNFANFFKDTFKCEKNLYIDGISNILSLPDFKDYNLADTFSESNENFLIKLLSEGLTSANIKVLIGSETHRKGLECISAVTSSYGEDKRPIGILGIIGPKRMEYEKMIAIVTSVSNMLNNFLKKFEER